MGLGQRYNRRVKQIRNEALFDKSRTSHYGDKPKQVGEDIVNQVANMSHNALNVDVREFYFFQRIKSGRRCSCVLGEQPTPEGSCQICFGTGFVGGFEKFGTRLEVIDSTSIDMNMIGVEPDYEGNVRPVLLKLSDNRTKGSIRASIPVKMNTGVVDVLKIVTSGVNQNAVINVYVKGNSQEESAFKKATLDNIQTLLEYNKIDFLIKFERAHTEDPSPLLSHIYLRYQQRDKMLIRGDIPKFTTSNSLGDLGFFDNFATIRMFTADDFIGYTADDFVIFQQGIKGKTYWKVVDCEVHDTFKRTITSDLTLTVIQDFESYRAVPA